MSLVGALSKETHQYYRNRYQNGQKNLRETFSKFVRRFAEDAEEKIKNGNDGTSIQTGASSYTKKEWNRLLRRVDAAQKKLEENEGNTGRVLEKRTNNIIKSTKENGEKEKSSLLEEMLEEVPKEEKGDSLEIFEQEPDMLLLTYTQAIYPSNDKSKEDTVYFTFYDTDGICCKKSGESGFEWKIPLKDSSQYEKVMEYLKKYEGQDNLWFASRKDFWRDFLEDGIDLEKFDSFMDTRVVDGIPQFVDYFEDRTDISLEALEFYKYMGGKSFGHLLTEEEINEMLYPKNGGKFVIDDISNINLRSLYALHPDEAGKRVNYYNGRWYTDYEMAVIARKEVVKLSKENRVAKVDFSMSAPVVMQRTYEGSIKKKMQDMGRLSFYKVDADISEKKIRMIVEPDKELDTGRYLISEKDGTLWIRDKQTESRFRYRFHSVGFEGMVQVDGKSGQRFMFDDFGSGFFTVQPVDDELYDGLKNFFQTEELPESEMTKFTLNTDTKTGISYVTENGYEWQGGHIIMADEARRKLDALAEAYRKEHPDIAKTYEEAYFYASFEVRGMAARTRDGILMLRENYVEHIGEKESNHWTVYFEEKYYQSLKELFDRSDMNWW